ncbi:MAG: hypothetical protein ACFFBZ_07980 [Promethearchaeota archaeon]
MVIKCPKCGIEYSYGRNICHICEDHLLFFGTLFNKDRREYQWNCNSKIISDVSPVNPPKSELLLNDEELLMEEKNSYEWNCDPALRVIQISFFDKKLGWNLVYE